MKSKNSAILEALRIQTLNESGSITVDKVNDAIDSDFEPEGFNSVEHVKSFLCDIFGFKDWKTLIKSQVYGTCAETSRLIHRKFPEIKIICGEGSISKSAAKKLKATSIADKQFVHYFNKIGNTYYDFGKGTNTENGVYLLDKLGDQFSVELTEKELDAYWKLRDATSALG